MSSKKPDFKKGKDFIYRDSEIKNKLTGKPFKIMVPVSKKCKAYYKKLHKDVEKYFEKD